MYLSKIDIVNTEKIRRLNLINSITGIKPGNLIGTKSNDGITNLAIISSVVHLSSSPASMGFILRPNSEVRRHTYENIQENGFYTINHIRTNFIEKAHYTSAMFEKQISEFDACKLTEEYNENFYAPYVKESVIKVGLRHVESIMIKTANTIMIVGEIEHLYVPDHTVDENGYINLQTAETAGISGLNSYYHLKHITSYPYARVPDVPKFQD